MFRFNDKMTLSEPRITRDGYLVADVRAARTGIQLYRGSEVGKPEMDVVRVYRPEEEVFSKDAMGSFAHRPVTNDHPSFLVDAKTWKEVARGSTGESVARDGEFIVVSMTLMDSDLIELVQSGKKELSAGYTCNLVDEQGISPEGEEYDMVQRDIRANHLAVVRQGRAGHDCRVGDEKPQEDKLKMNLIKVMVDSLSVETTEAGAEAIRKLQKDNDSLIAAAQGKAEEHQKALGDKDRELAAKDAEIEKLKDAQMSDADLDKLVADRAAVVSKAKALCKDANFDGLSNAEIRKKVVSDLKGAERVADKSDDYIEATFDGLAETIKDGVRDALTQQPKGGQTFDKADPKSAHEEMKKGLADAWKMGA